MRGRWTWQAAVVGLVLVLWAGAARADEEPEATATELAEDCVWLPDVRCGRSGRPEGFYKPIVQPYLFEDPFVTTGIYPYYVYHDFPNQSAFQGGDAHVAALQLRAALTDRLAFIATKDGYMWRRPDNPLLDHTQGWLNLGAGFKYLLFEDEERGIYVSPALRFEFDSGSTDNYQDHGDGLVIPSISAAWALGRFHLIGGLGGNIPLDGGDNSSNVFYHLYADYAVHPRFSPFVQISGITWIESGNGEMPVQLKHGGSLPLGVVQTALGTGRFEGADIANLGSQGVDNLDLVTAAVGGHIKLAEHVTWSFAYERAITRHKGIFQQRFTTALAIEF
jgi:hypothetical protein